MAFWRREVTVRYRGAVLTKPKIALDVTYDLGNPAVADISVYNLAKTTEQAIDAIGEAIVVEAGYAGNKGVVFNGSVQRIDKKRKGLERIVTLNATSQAVAVDNLGGFFSRTYQGRERLTNIVEDIVTIGMGLQVGSLAPIPGSILIADWSWNGKASTALKSILRQYELTYYEDQDGLVQFSSARKVSRQAASHSISMQSGLLESPTVTEDGVKFKSLMNPRLKLEDTIRVVSEFVNEVYKIVAVSHKGDNWNGAYTTEIEAHNVQS